MRWQDHTSISSLDYHSPQKQISWQEQGKQIQSVDPEVKPSEEIKNKMGMELLYLHRLGSVTNIRKCDTDDHSLKVVLQGILKT